MTSGDATFRSNKVDGQYHFTHFFDELMVSTGSTTPIENEMANLLQIVASPDTNASTHLVLEKTVVSAEHTQYVQNVHSNREGGHLPDSK